MQPSVSDISVEEYLRLDAGSEDKLEYHAGRIYAMAGASLAHNMIAANVLAELRARLRNRGCRTVGSDMRVRITHRHHDFTYPDVVVVCGEAALTGEAPGTLTNPALIVEVVSDSTADRDRGWKLWAYTQIPSLQEYWIVAQDEAAVTRYLRRNEGWELQVLLGREASIESAFFDDPVPLEEIYAQLASP